MTVKHRRKEAESQRENNASGRFYNLCNFPMLTKFIYNHNCTLLVATVGMQEVKSLYTLTVGVECAQELSSECTKN